MATIIAVRIGRTGRTRPLFPNGDTPINGGLWRWPQVAVYTTSAHAHTHGYIVDSKLNYTKLN